MLTILTSTARFLAHVAELAIDSHPAVALHRRSPDPVPGWSWHPTMAVPPHLLDDLGLLDSPATEQAAPGQPDRRLSLSSFWNGALHHDRTGLRGVPQR